MYMPTAGCQFSAEDLIIWFLQKVTSSALKGTNVTHTLSMVSKYPSWRLRYCFPKNQIAHTLMCIDTNQNTLCSFENGCQSIFSGIWQQSCNVMMTSSNGNIFRVTGPLCGNSPVKGEFPEQRSVTRSFDVLFDLRQNKMLSKWWWCWWFETPPHPIWRHWNVNQLTRSDTYCQILLSR